MHYYKRNIGDYNKKAGRLSMLQHGSYNLLLDACYDREQFPTLDEAIDWSWADSPEEIASVKFVLKKFFTFTDGVYVQKRVAEELAKYHKNSAVNKKIAITRENKKRTNRERTVNEPPPNQEPRTKNHKPLTKEPEEKKQPSPGKPGKLNNFNTGLIFDFWKETLNHPRAKFDDKRRMVILKAFKMGFAEDQLKSAITGISLTPHNMGQNDNGQKYDGLHIIFKDANQIERFISNSNNPPTGKPGAGISKGNDKDYHLIDYQKDATKPKDMPAWVKLPTSK